METGLIYLNEFTKAMFEAFPTFRMEVSFGKPSTRADKPWVHMLNLMVRLWDDYTERVYGWQQKVILYELEQMKDPKGYWLDLASRARLELLKRMEETDTSHVPEEKSRCVKIGDGKGILNKG